MTAAVALHQRLALPDPWFPPSTTLPPTPLVVYGAASAVGIYALQLALRNPALSPILCVAGHARDHVASFLPTTTTTKTIKIIDYRLGDEAVITDLTTSLQGLPAPAILDAVSAGSSVQNIGEVLRRLGGGGGGKVTFVLDGEKQGMPETGVEWSITRVTSVHKDERDFGYVYFRYFARGLQEGWFRGQRTEVVPGGLGGVEKALGDLKAGRASGVKYVFRVGETEGVQR